MGTDGKKIPQKGPTMRATRTRARWAGVDGLELIGDDGLRYATVRGYDMGDGNRWYEAETTAGVWYEKGIESIKAKVASSLAYVVEVAS